MPTTEEILKKYSSKIESQMQSYSDEDYSKDYDKFKREMIPEMKPYEKWAKALGSYMKVKLSPKEYIRLKNNLDAGHLEITPSQAALTSLTVLIMGILAVVMISAIFYILYESYSILFIFLGFVASLFLYYYISLMPARLASEWRLQASSQMVPSILYMVVYMKHTSNLERAVAFASEHLEGPLALDFKKIFYDVEIGKFQTIKQSIDSYLESWKDYAPEYIESFHLIESSLFEPSESRRIEILEKSLQVILDGIYEKMLKYSRSVRSPLTNIYMLGIILPTLGLALLPLASTILGGNLRIEHFFIMFNIIVPFFVFYLTSEVLLKRPGGYGESAILELNPDYYKYSSRKPWLTAAMISLPLLLIGLIPLIMQIEFITSALSLQSDYSLGELGFPIFQDMKLFGYLQTPNGLKGPFSPIATILSLFIPLSLALFFSITYKLKTRDLIKSREKTKILEQEFTNSLFQFGNRLGDGIPAEIAFAKVAESTQGQITQQFFLQVNQNIQQLGMSIDSAIFDKRRGAIIYFPSALISTSMKILIESAKKGLKVAAQSLMSISVYLKNIEKINQRLRDLLAEVISDMKSNMTFLAPLLAGIVVGLGVMISTILIKLQDINQIANTGDSTGVTSFSEITKIFNVAEMIPPYYLEIIIGFYIIEIIFILTTTLVTIDAGKDSLKEKNQISKNLITGAVFYLLTALVSVSALALLSSIALSGIN
jgi:hypothetical protein